MKKILVLAAALILTYSQQAFSQNDSIPLYTVLYNQAPEGFDYPLIGLINHGIGSHKGAQIGLINMNRQDFLGAQLGFLNTSGGDMNGLQAGFVNTVVGNVTGLQTGFINTTAESLRGSQLGFINTAVKESNGLQVGFINTSAKKLDGAQIGFVNTSPEEVTGAQIGFVNSTGKLSTIQLGFLNYADSLDDSGVPIGFLSIIRHGGYQAIEMGYTELFTYNLAAKIGIPALYTTLNAAYNPDFQDSWALGAGFGSNIAVGPIFFVNPEAYYLHQLKSENYLVRFNFNFGVNLGRRFQLVAGPSATWTRIESGEQFLDPQFYFHRESFDWDDELLVGFNAALRIKLSN